MAKQDLQQFSSATLSLIKQITARAGELENPQIEQMLDEVRDYLSVGKLLGATIDFQQPRSIRHAQRALAKMEAYLDRVMVLQHDAKRVLQIISAVETQLLGLMVRHGEIPSKTTGPVQQQTIAAAVPRLARVKSHWETLEQICQQAQRRIASAKDAVKLQSQLDDNLRWAQFRNPG